MKVSKVTCKREIVIYEFKKVLTISAKGCIDSMRMIIQEDVLERAAG